MTEADWKLFLDDLRDPTDDSYVVARNVAEAQVLIERLGFPIHISFDHDLGIDESGDVLPSGYDFAKWLVEMDMDGIHTFHHDFTFTVHSMNPIGSKNIKSYLKNYLDKTK